MYLILVIGMTGQGKSTLIKKLIRNKRAFIFDINNEYQDFSDDFKAPRARYIEGDSREFIALCQERTQTHCVLEDATGFIAGNIGLECTRMLVKKRHSENTYYLLFHSINSVPPRIMEMSNYVVLLKTTDEISKVEKKYPRLLKPFLRLIQMPQYSSIIIKMIPQ